MQNIWEVLRNTYPSPLRGSCSCHMLWVFSPYNISIIKLSCSCFFYFLAIDTQVYHNYLNFYLVRFKNIYITDDCLEHETQVTSKKKILSFFYICI